MKNLIFLMALLISQGLLMAQMEVQHTDSMPGTAEQQSTAIFQHLAINQINTGHLKEYGFSFAPIESFNGTITAPATSNWYIFKQLYASMFTNQLPSATYQYLHPNTIQKLADSITLHTDSTTAIIAFIHQPYNYFDTNAVANNLITVTNNQLYDVANRAQSPYLQSELLAAATLKNLYHSLTLNMLISDKLFFNQSGKTISTITLNNNENADWVSISINNNVSLTFNEAGIKTLTIKIKYTDNTVYCANFQLKIAASATANRYSDSYNRKQYLFTGTRTFAGDDGTNKAASATVTVAYGCGHNHKLIKPFIIVDGFDPTLQFGNFVSFNDIVGSGYLDKFFIGGHNLKKELEEGGYDLVFVDFLGRGSCPHEPFYTKHQMLHKDELEIQKCQSLFHNIGQKNNSIQQGCLIKASA